MQRIYLAIAILAAIAIAMVYISYFSFFTWDPPEWVALALSKVNPSECKPPNCEACGFEACNDYRKSCYVEPVRYACGPACNAIAHLCMKGPAETGPETSCDSDEDCWCGIFDGSRFLPGRASGTCNFASNKCNFCIYK